MKESSIRDCLDNAGPRPPESAKQKDKKNYAERLSHALATKIANSLRRDFKHITPDKDGRQQEKRARSAKGFKKLDVNYSTPELGLGLGISVKTIGYRDKKSKNYVKNITRIDNELRAEAIDYHLRQPYAVMIAILFLPVDSCDDGNAKRGTPSSFGRSVHNLRFRANRVNPRNEEQLFERIFIGLYEPEGPQRGYVTFFDIMSRPPKFGRPRKDNLMSFSNLVAEIKSTFDLRNNPPFQWDLDEN